ncbi:hypothetical protein ID1001_13640 [Helicobacter pylori]
MLNKYTIDIQLLKQQKPLINQPLIDHQTNSKMPVFGGLVGYKVSLKHSKK